MMSGMEKHMDFFAIENTLDRVGVLIPASESHGVLCGLLCVKGQVSYDNWVNLIFDEDDSQLDLLDQDNNTTETSPKPRQDKSGSPDEWNELQELYNETIVLLKDEDYIFRLLLPDDEQLLGDRTRALVDWCEGFLFGLAAGEIKDFAQLPDDVYEISQDLAEITRAYLNEEEDAELDEVAYTELVEYVRVGALVIYQTLQLTRESRSGNEAIH